MSTPVKLNGDLEWYIEVQLRVSCMHCHDQEQVWVVAHINNVEGKKPSLIIDELPEPWTLNCIGLPECGCE